MAEIRVCGAFKLCAFKLDFAILWMGSISGVRCVVASLGGGAWCAGWEEDGGIDEMMNLFVIV